MKEIYFRLENILISLALSYLTYLKMNADNLLFKNFFQNIHCKFLQELLLK
jgi:hypothetical protein